MTTIHTPLDHGDLLVARRAHAQATARLVAGITVSTVGIAALVALLVLLAELGASPTVGQGLGVFLLGAIAFAVSAWGTDLRHRALIRRKASRARIAQLEA